MLFLTLPSRHQKGNRTRHAGRYRCEVARLAFFAIKNICTRSSISLLQQVKIIITVIVLSFLSTIYFDLLSVLHTGVHICATAVPKHPVSLASKMSIEQLNEHNSSLRAEDSGEQNQEHHLMHWSLCLRAPRQMIQFSLSPTQSSQLHVVCQVAEHNCFNKIRVDQSLNELHHASTHKSSCGDTHSIHTVIG